MSQEITRDEVIIHKKKSIKRLNQLLERLIGSDYPDKIKKANLIAYWLETFSDYVSHEESFKPAKLISYKRGNVIKVNFGFNIGAEYGGLHYAVVLDMHNDHNSPVITVVPLTSKTKHQVHNHNVYLGNDLYRLLQVKSDTLSDQIKEQQETVDMFQNLSKLYAESDESDVPTILNNFNQFIQTKTQELDKSLARLEKIKQEISRMKQGSIALVSQVTTISKMRIRDPKSVSNTLSGISLSSDNMTLIDEKIKELYVFNS